MLCILITDSTVTYFESELCELLPNCVAGEALT